MKILRLHIKNINSLNFQTTIDFTQSPLADTGIFAITGDTGSGKTTILDAITLALYGKIARNDSKAGALEVMSFGETECHAEVEFETNTKKYLAKWRMHRARSKVDGNLIGPTRELAEWQEKKEEFIGIGEKKSEVSKLIEEITGLDYGRFTRSVLLSQGDFAAFLKAKDKERSELLERITGTDIYSKISVAAFEKNKEEQSELKALQEQLHQLDQLEEEPVAEEQIESLKAELTSLQKEIKEDRETKTRFESWQKLTLKTVELVEEAEEIKEQETLFEVDQKRLAAARLLRPLHKELDEEKALDEDLAVLEENKKHLARQLETSEKTLREKEEKLAQITTNFAAFKTASIETNKKLQQADALDIRLDNLQKTSNEKQQSLTDLQTDIKANQVNLAQLKTKTKSLKEEKEATSSWLETHQKYSDLSEQLPAIEQIRQQLRVLWKQLEQSKKEITEKQEELKTWEIEKQQIQKELTSKNEILEKLSEQIKAKLPNGFDWSKEAALQRLSTEIDQLQEQEQVLQKLAAFDQDYQILLTEQSQYQDRLNSLFLAQQQTTKELLNNAELRENFEPELKYCRKVFQQQQRLANYQKDRLNLQPGEACPLCLSTEHPFHEHPPEPFVDEAKLALEKAEKYVERLHKEERKLLQQEGEYSQEIDLLQGDELKTVAGRLANQKQKIAAFEQKIAALLKLGNTENTQGRGLVLTKQLGTIQQQLEDWRSSRAALSTLLQQQNEIATTTQQLEQQQASLLAKLEANTVQLEKAIVQKEKFEEQFAETQTEINTLLEKYDYQFDAETAKKTFEILQAFANNFRQATKKKEQSVLALALAEKELNLLSQNAERQEKEAQQLQKEKKRLLTDLQVITAERIALIGEEKTEIIRDKLQTESDNWEAQQQQLQTARNTLREQAAALQQSAKENEERQQKQDLQRKNVRKKLLPALANLGYQNIEESRLARISVAEESKLEEQQQALILQKTRWDKISTETQKELKELSAFKLDEIEEQRFYETLQTKESQLQEKQRTLGQFLEKKEQQEKRKQQHQGLLTQIENKRKTSNRWHQLNEIIGQADGKKFRSFAQGLTLQKLVALANHHLEKLNGRYQINKKENEDLALEIIDTFQADNRRSMYTLSGGETFLVSLALALGLSDLASRHANIQSLFIDEGFGSLDENSLDLALSTLENLQSTGKIIGLISHVPLLKERISTQIQVQKQSNGFSAVELVS